MYSTTVCTLTVHLTLEPLVAMHTHIYALSLHLKFELGIRIERLHCTLSVRGAFKKL